MSEQNLIELAVRKKLRFESTKGHLTVEQLFDLPFNSKSGCDLQNVATVCNEEVKACGEVDFVGTAKPVAKTAQLKLDVVKYVIATKQNEHAVALSENQKAAEKQRLMGLLSRKKDEELEGKSAEEIQAMIDSL